MSADAPAAAAEGTAPHRAGSARANAGFIASVRRIVPLAWPVFVGQVAVLAFGTLDTVLVGRHATADLAALAVGGAAYITVFIGLMGVVMAVSPVVGRLYGAGQWREAGHQFWQALWLALGLSLVGSLLLAFPAPFIAWAKAGPAMADKVRLYLLALAFSLPATLVFTVFRGFNTAVSRPKTVMTLQLAGLALKVPLSLALIGGVPALGIAPLGVVGCGLGTMAVMWAQALAAAWLLRRDGFYRRFAFGAPGQRAPSLASLRALLKLGVPMGAGIAVEVTGFSAMALFIARLGETAVAGHQIAANLVSLLFMLPLGLANGTAALVAQRIGAGDLHDARRLGVHGLQFTLALSLAVGAAVFIGRQAVVSLYTGEPAVAAVTLSLLAWVVVFHAADAAQVLTAFVLCAWHVAVWPMLIYVAALWGVGLAGGRWLAAGQVSWLPTAWHGPRGFWVASTTGLTLAALALTLLMLRVSRQRVD